MSQRTGLTNETRTWLTTIAFVVSVCLVGGLIGTSSMPDAWYTALHKAPWNPPNWVFGPVWFVLYLLIAIAGARTLLRDPRGPAMFFWLVQMCLNWAWSPIWFRGHAPWVAFGVIIAMLFAVGGFVVTTWRVDRTSALLFAPYGAWIGFAGSLNLWIALAN